jgi:hypothetical protein
MMPEQQYGYSQEVHGHQDQLCSLFCAGIVSQKGIPCEVNPAIEFSAQKIPIKIGV